jgi:hypothetical protein
LPAVLAVIAHVPVTDAILDRAAHLTDPALRTLDAIHLASAEAIPDITAMLAYDKRLTEAARAIGLAVASPS